MSDRDICGSCRHKKTIEIPGNNRAVDICALDPPRPMNILISGDKTKTPAFPEGHPDRMEIHSMYPKCINEIGCGQFIPNAAIN